MLKSSLSVTVAAFSLVSVANATELPKKKLPVAPAAKQVQPVAAPVPFVKVDRWSGAYIGAFAGLQKMGSRLDNQGEGLAGTLDGLEGHDDSWDGGVTFSEAAAQSLTSSGDASEYGGLYGATFGINHRVNDSVVIGLEFDIAKLTGETSKRFTGSSQAAYDCDFEGCSEFDDVTSNVDVKSGANWLGTLRGRAGLLVTDNLLVFGTGGLAVGQVSVNTNISQTWEAGTGSEVCWGDDPETCNGTTTATGSGSSTEWRVGYTVGGGAEYALSDHWSAKLDYLYYNLGSVDAEAHVTASGYYDDTAMGTVSSEVHTKAEISGQIARFGINYKF